jgi:hypothetical protein
VLQININIPSELLAFFRPAPARIAPPAIATNGPEMLVPHGALPGPKLSIEEFCERHALDDEICARFWQNKYTKTTETLAYIKLSQLELMGFMGGEIAQVQFAVSSWTVPTAWNWSHRPQIA